MPLRLRLLAPGLLIAVIGCTGVGRGAAALDEVTPRPTRDGAVVVPPVDGGEADVGTDDAGAPLPSVTATPPPRPLQLPDEPAVAAGEWAPRMDPPGLGGPEEPGPGPDPCATR